MREGEKKDVYTKLPPFSCDKSSYSEVSLGHCLRHGFKVISGNRKERRKLSGQRAWQTNLWHGDQEEGSGLVGSLPDTLPGVSWYAAAL